MDPIDRTFLAQAGSTCRAAVVASDMPRAGTREEVLEGTAVLVVTHEIMDFCTSVERLAWAKASGCPWVARTFAYVARHGRLDVLRWAREYKCPWDEWTCAYAAWGGHLEVLKWAREHLAGAPCPWDWSTCSNAAYGGHLDVLQWAREHGCPWSKWNCALYSRDHPETLAWVRAQPE